ncbi:MAG: M28 family metallopeptidase, partial [Longimicrobiales bacterium]
TQPQLTEAAPNLRITLEAAAQLFGRSVEGMAAGTTGGTVTAQLDFVEERADDFARNVIGIIRGSDPTLAGQYVAVGAHNDHVGFTGNPVDHDSARAYTSRELQLRMAGGDLDTLNAEQRGSIKVNVDSLRKIRPMRLDSINNGADDDGSGSMAVLEIAEAIARMPQKPKRSILLVWHTAEERGLTGASYFTQNPTVPRDSIVAQINIDMIGRGRANDIPGGGDDYVAVVGSKRLSAELGQMVVDVNRKQQRQLKLDYRFDETVTWAGYNNIYGRSDHARYARFNIPIAFFFTGLHGDYHRVTDEPQYIDYPHYTRITNYIRELVEEVANRNQRPALDKPISE